MRNVRVLFLPGLPGMGVGGEVGAVDMPSGTKAEKKYWEFNPVTPFRNIRKNFKSKK